MSQDISNETEPQKRRPKINIAFLEVTFPALPLIPLADIIIKIVVSGAYLLHFINLWILLPAVILPSLLLEQWKKYKLKKYHRQFYNQIHISDYNQFNQVKLSTQMGNSTGTFYPFAGFIILLLAGIQWVHPVHWYGYCVVVLIAVGGSQLFAGFGEAASIPSSFDPLSLKAYEYWTAELIKVDVSHQFALPLANIERLFLGSTPIDEVDFNDFEIARLESSLKDVSTRVDSYMLESVLLGALTFSGFLSIVASDKWTSFNRILDFNISGTLNVIKQLNYDVVIAAINQLSLPENLYPLLLAEMLVCSLFFILILGLRMRFSQLAVKAAYLMEVLRIFNGKEEELLHIELTGVTNDTITQRKEKIRRKITETIENANLLLKDIRPLERIIGIYRNIGLVTFFLLLVTSGLFFSPMASVIIFGIAAITWLYRFIETEVKKFRILKLLSEHRNQGVSKTE